MTDRCISKVTHELARLATQHKVSMRRFTGRSVAVSLTQNIAILMCETTVPFQPGVQSRITAEKKDHFKIHHKLKEIFSAFSETKIPKS
jgi:hypothetical protein